MDIVRSVQLPLEDELGEQIVADGEPQYELFALFSEISVGDAP